MGGYFIGRPMDPESRPAKTKEAVPSHESSHMGWAGDKLTKARVEKGGSPEEGVQVQPGVLVWKDKAQSRTPYMRRTRYNV